MRTWQVHSFKDVSSTMDVAHDMLAQMSLSPSEGMVVMAETQTMGRGRRQRQWQSPSGNFYGSFAFVPPLPQSAYPLYSFAVLMALFDTINQMINRGSMLTVKWPNDLLLNGKKVAGILLELAHTQTPSMIVGIGVNLKSAPTAVTYPATDLFAETHTRILPEDFMSLFLPHLTTQLDLLETQGFAPIRQAWLEARYPQDDLCVKVSDTSEMRGTFVDLDLEGRLILKEAHTNASLKIASGDVFLKI